MNTAVLGLSVGDEGKAKITDLLAQEHIWIVRFNGSGNAGHTIVTNDGRKLVFRLLPSGLMYEHTKCVLGQGMVIDPIVLLSEIKDLAIFTGKPLKQILSQIYVSQNAHIVMPYHVQIDQARSISKNIGTTGKGVGPAYESKIRRTGVRAGDFAECSDLIDKIVLDIASWNPEMTALGLEQPLVSDVLTTVFPGMNAVQDKICDTAKLLNETDEPILFEGAQAALLDIDNGTYPYVTSSSATIGGVLTGSGVERCGTFDA